MGMSTQSIPHNQTISHREVVETLYTRLAASQSRVVRESIGQATIDTLRGQNARKVLFGLRRGRYLDKPLLRQLASGQRIHHEQLPANLPDKRRERAQLEAKDLCERALASLDSIDRAICEGLSRSMTLSEIACQFGITRQAVSYRLIKIREKFRLALAD